MEGLVDRMRVAGFELEFSSAFPVRRPSIYDVHTEGGGGQAQVDVCERGRGQAPCGRLHRILKLESSDVILSSSFAKKLVYFLLEFHLWTE